MWGLGTNISVAGEVLTMSNITRAYSGDYVCNADNGVGRWPVTQVISLDVLCKLTYDISSTFYDVTLLCLDAPEVETDHKWIHCGEGESVTLVCRVYSNPLAKVINIL